MGVAPKVLHETPNGTIRTSLVRERRDHNREVYCPFLGWVGWLWRDGRAAAAYSYSLETLVDVYPAGVHPRRVQVKLRCPESMRSTEHYHLELASNLALCHELLWSEGYFLGAVALRI